MGISATQIAAAIVLFAVISPQVTRRVLTKLKDGRPAWLPGVAVAGCWLITLVAGALIAEWWAVAVALLAIATGNPLKFRDEIHREESAAGEANPKVAFALTFAGILLIELVPVIIGVAIGR